MAVVKGAGTAVDAGTVSSLEARRVTVHVTPIGKRPLLEDVV
jgi:hypothetical protein